MSRSLGRLRVGGRRVGFTLVELMVAMVILTVGLIATASVMSGVARREVLSSSRIELMTIADNKFEELRAFATTRSVDTLQLAIGGSLTVPTAFHADTVKIPGGRQYARRWVVSAGPAGTRSVTVRAEPLEPRRLETRRLDFTGLMQIL